MKNKINITLLSIILCIAALIFSSCGSGRGGDGGDDAAGAEGTGSVAVLLKDLPADDLAEINIVIKKIELLSDNFKVTVYAGSKEFDLLDLKNETMLFSVGDNVPAVSYNKIRLTVSSLVLKDNNGKEFSSPDGVSLPGNGKIDLNPRSAFTVEAGKMLVLRLDLDAEKSIHLVEHPVKNKYNFRPVVFIDVIGNISQQELLRIPGIVHDINKDAGTFNICPETGSGFSCCTAVNVSAETSFFSSSIEGHPALFDDLAEGHSATVIGFSHISDGSGTCGMGVDAVVVEIGGFLKLTGTIQSGVNTSGIFAFLVDPDQEVKFAGPISVQLQEGTKIYSYNGIKLDSAAVMENRTAEIDGVLILTPEVLNAAFISVDTGSAASNKLSGDISSINYVSETFDLVNSDGTACVEVTGDTNIFRITEIEGIYNSELIDFAALANGDSADVFGKGYNTVSGCFVADTIIAFKSD